MNRDVDCPPLKRIRLDSSPTPPRANQRPTSTTAQKLAEEDNCSICLQSIADRTVIPTCSHEFCFECLLVWSEQSRKCPLCSQSLGDHVIHHIRSKHDYQKHYLPPLRTSPRPVQHRNRNIARRVDREWGPRERQAREDADRLDRAISRRRWIYHHHLYAKHIASNSFTRYRPCPTPAQFAASPDLVSRVTTFLRRELRVWINLDVEFLTTFILSLMKSIDIRSESAIKLLAEFLDMDTEYIEGQRFPNAENFAHEVYSYLRSPYKDLFVYDTVVQYDVPPGLPPPPEHERSRRWRSPASRSRSHSRSPARRNSPLPSPSRSLSWSPSGRHLEGSRGRFLHKGEDETDTHGEGYRSRSRGRHIDGKNPDQKDACYNDRKERSTDDQPRDCVKDPHGDPVNEDKGKQKARDWGEEDVRFTSKDPTPIPDLVVPQATSPSNPAVGPLLTDSEPHDTQTNRSDPTEFKECSVSRHRSLRESVRAHLAPQRQPVDVDTFTLDQAISNVHRCDTTVNATPSARPIKSPPLSTHLRDQASPVPNSPVQLSQCTPPNADADQVNSKPRVSRPEIMARTRARFAKLKRDIIVKSIENQTSAFPQDSLPKNHSMGANSVADIDIAESRDARARLLSRLEDERGKLQDRLPSSSISAAPAIASIQTNYKGGPSSLLTRIPSLTADVHDITQARAETAETDLRRRAQLHARLAAAKKSL